MLQTKLRLCCLIVNLIYKKNTIEILNDEKYFLNGGDNDPWNDRYYTDDKVKCTGNVRFKDEAKFHEKILVWIAISERGILNSLFRISKAVAINGPIYLEECLKRNSCFH